MQPADPITIEDKEYAFADLTPHAQKMITFMQSIDQNLTSLDTQMQMMQITRDGCYLRLITEVKIHTEEIETSEAGRVQENPDAE
jgi:hypothetical protein